MARSGTNTMSVSYDAQNRVVSRTVNGVTTTYAYDGWNLIEDYDASGNELARYIHGPQSDELLAKISPTGALYYLQDGNQNVTTITDSTGAVQERYTYDVYGAVTITDGSGNSLSVSGVGNRFMFTGREFLAPVGLYDYRNRVYSATLGRFLQTDPIRFQAGDINIYRYVGNGPVNGIDAMGLCHTPDNGFHYDPSGSSNVGPVANGPSIDDANGGLSITPNFYTGETSGMGSTGPGYSPSSSEPYNFSTSVDLGIFTGGTTGDSHGNLYFSAGFTTPDIGGAITGGSGTPSTGWNTQVSRRKIWFNWFLGDWWLSSRYRSRNGSSDRF